jgi:hypothetical protein
VINGSAQTAEWQGVILPYSDASVEVEVDEYDIKPSGNAVSFAISGVNGTARSGSAKSFNTFSAPYFVEGSNSVTLEFATDLWGDEITWTVKDRDGNVFYQNTPYPAGQQTQDKDTFVLQGGGIYAFEIKDWLGDGMSATPKGSYKLRKGTGAFIYENRDVRNYGDCFFFKVDTATQVVLSASEIFKSLKTDNTGVFPNPATDYVTVDVSDGTLIELYSMEGRLLKRTRSKTLNIQGLPKGIYMLKADNKTVRIIKK